MPELPAPVRALLGLAVAAVEEAHKLPDKAIELPMVAVSRALQLSLRAQQRYAFLAAKGDEVLAAHGTADEAPQWATFDEPGSFAPARDLSAVADPVATRDEAPTLLVPPPAVAPAAKASAAKASAAKASAAKAPAKKANPAARPAKVTPAKVTPAKVTPAKASNAEKAGTVAAKTALGTADPDSSGAATAAETAAGALGVATPVGSTPATDAPIDGAAIRAAAAAGPITGAAPAARPAKTVNAPRTGTPSAFDAADPDELDEPGGS